MKHLVAVSIVGVVLVITGCGGGNNSSDNNPSNSAPPAQAQGVYTGTTSTGRTFDVIILPTDTFYAVYGMPVFETFYADGMLTGQGSASNGKFTAIVTDFYYGEETGVTITGSVTATYVPGSSVSGTYTEGANTLTFSGTVPPSSVFNYNKSASLSDVIGTWAGTLGDGTTAIATVNADGSFSGSDSGCSFSGTMTPDTSGKNFFRVSVTLGASPCASSGQTQSGVAVDYLLSDGVTHQLVAGFSATSSGNVFAAVR